jgi:hypothetical protein
MLLIMLSKIARKKTRMRPIATSRAAALKGWRTRKRMQQVRREEAAAESYQRWVKSKQDPHYDKLRKLSLEKFHDLVTQPPEENPKLWPVWMKRALPNPWI